LNNRFFFLAAMTLLSGCFHRPGLKGPGDPEKGVTVRWYGHSCFTIEDSAGRLFEIDPFDQTVGHDLPYVDPDVVLLTHPHFDHNYPRMAVKYELMSSTGTSTVAGVEVTGIAGFHDAMEGRRHGPTNFYVWDMGGLRLAHLGDVGQKELSAAQLALLGRVDVLFVPVGGKTTVDAAGAANIVRVVNPRVAVPMHYDNPQVRFFKFDPVEPFLKLFENVQRLPHSDFQITRASLPAGLTVFVPALPRQKS